MTCRHFRLIVKESYYKYQKRNVCTEIWETIYPCSPFWNWIGVQQQNWLPTMVKYGALSIEPHFHWKIWDLPLILYFVYALILFNMIKGMYENYYISCMFDICSSTIPPNFRRPFPSQPPMLTTRRTFPPALPPRRILQGGFNNIPLKPRPPAIHSPGKQKW